MTTHPINPGTKMHVIETEVKGMKYWVRITYKGARFPSFQFEGLRDNATEFPSEKSAHDTLLLIQPKTENHLTVIPKN